MKKLTDILQNIECSTTGNTNIEISGIAFDSRKVKPKYLFIAVKGYSTDGHNFIDSAIKNGAKAILCENIPTEKYSDITFIKTNDSAKALGIVAANFYNNPSNKLKLIGITGTNGKTTTATLLHNLFTLLGYNTGLISTIRNIAGNRVIDATHTTPDPIQLQSLLAEMTSAGCDYVFMEVSSHALHQKRTAGSKFTGGIFTNITQDHLDYHKTFKEYIKAKKLFFDNLPTGAFALTNADDKNAAIMVQNCKAEKYTYALKRPADYKVRIIEKHLDGMLISINGTELWTSFIGDFNAYNLVSVFATAILLEQKTEEVLTNLSLLKPVDGRFQYFKSKKGITAVIDYAHTPDALKNVLKTIKEIIEESDGKIITVTGAGGNRDKGKRPLMTKEALKVSSRVILTSDNPRNELPEMIINDMKEGIIQPEMSKILSITDRREAIRTAILLAQPGDIVLIAGKGHETYQEINGVKHHFDDREVIREIFENE